MSANEHQRFAVPLDQRLARAAVRPLASTPITPNMVTLFGMFLGLCAGCLLALGDQTTVHSAAALFMIAVWMDHADGELARLTGKTSRIGHYLDHVGAMTSYVAMFVGAGVGLRHGPLGYWTVVAGITAGVSIVGIFTTRLLIEEQLGSRAVQQPSMGGFEIEDTLYIVGPITWLGGLLPFVLIAGVGTPLFLIWVVLQAIRLIRNDRVEHPKL